jgi:transposase
LVEPLLPIGGYAPYPHRLRDLKAWRVIATRYDKTPESYLAALHLRGAIIGSAVSAHRHQ